MNDRKQSTVSALHINQSTPEMISKAVSTLHCNEISDQTIKINNNNKLKDDQYVTFKNNMYN